MGYLLFFVAVILFFREAGSREPRTGMIGLAIGLAVLGGILT